MLRRGGHGGHRQVRGLAQGDTLAARALFARHPALRAPSRRLGLGRERGEGGVRAARSDRGLRGRYERLLGAGKSRRLRLARRRAAALHRIALRRAALRRAHGQARGERGGGALRERARVRRWRAPCRVFPQSGVGVAKSGREGRRFGAELRAHSRLRERRRQKRERKLLYRRARSGRNVLEGARF